MSAVETETKPRLKPVLVTEQLHAQLKAKAQREGRKLQAMVETKLRELVEAEQLELETAAR